MKKILITLFIATISIASFGQQTEAYKRYLDESKLANNNMRATFCLKSFTNEGVLELPAIETFIKSHFTEGYERDENKPWMYQSFYTPVAETEDPQVIITGTYVYTKTIDENEKVVREKSGNPALPYIMLTTNYMAEISIALNYQYQDGSSIKDTIAVSKNKTVKLGDEPITFDKLEKSLIGSTEHQIKQLTACSKGDKTWLKFPKVKVKDKALKEELGTVSKLLKDGEYSKAGAIYKKIFEAKETPEASVALAMCYELVGNYPKAKELYKAKPDFQINSRMKKSMKLLEYAQSIGYEPTFIEF